jgi:hypothetical protein
MDFSENNWESRFHSSVISCINLLEGARKNRNALWKNE